MSAKTSARGTLSSIFSRSHISRSSVFSARKGRRYVERMTCTTSSIFGGSFTREASTLSCPSSILEKSKASLTLSKEGSGNRRQEPDQKYIEVLMKKNENILFREILENWKMAPLFFAAQLKMKTWENSTIFFNNWTFKKGTWMFFEKEEKNYESSSLRPKNTQKKRTSN